MMKGVLKKNCYLTVVCSTSCFCNLENVVVYFSISTIRFFASLPSFKLEIKQQTLTSVHNSLFIKHFQIHCIHVLVPETVFHLHILHVTDDRLHNVPIYITFCNIYTY